MRPRGRDEPGPNGILARTLLACKRACTHQDVQASGREKDRMLVREDGYWIDPDHRIFRNECNTWLSVAQNRGEF